MCCGGKCGGTMLILAGILLGLISMGVWSSWLNLTSFFAIMAILGGIHAFGCKECQIGHSKKK